MFGARSQVSYSGPFRDMQADGCFGGTVTNEPGEPCLAHGV